jgi:hypothetical protein
MQVLWVDDFTAYGLKRAGNHPNHYLNYLNSVSDRRIGQPLAGLSDGASQSVINEALAATVGFQPRFLSFVCACFFVCCGPVTLCKRSQPLCSTLQDLSPFSANPLLCSIACAVTRHGLLTAGGDQNQCEPFYAIYNRRLTATPLRRLMLHSM